MKIKMNTKRVKMELARIGKSQGWLARELKISRQLMSYHMRKRTVKGAEMIARVFKIDAKDLL